MGCGGAMHPPPPNLAKGPLFHFWPLSWPKFKSTLWVPENSLLGGSAPPQIRSYYKPPEQDQICFNLVLPRRLSRWFLYHNKPRKGTGVKSPRWGWGWISLVTVIHIKYMCDQRLQQQQQQQTNKNNLKKKKKTENKTNTVLNRDLSFPGWRISRRNFCTQFYPWPK